MATVIRTQADEALRRVTAQQDTARAMLARRAGLMLSLIHI